MTKWANMLRQDIEKEWNASQLLPLMKTSMLWVSTSVPFIDSPWPWVPRDRDYNSQQPWPDQLMVVYVGHCSPATSWGSKVRSGKSVPRHGRCDLSLEHAHLSFGMCILCLQMCLLAAQLPARGWPLLPYQAPLKHSALGLQPNDTHSDASCPSSLATCSMSGYPMQLEMLLRG